MIGVHTFYIVEGSITSNSIRLWGSFTSTLESTVSIIILCICSRVLEGWRVGCINGKM